MQSHDSKILDFANALKTAVLLHANPKLLRVQHDKIFFNGFWRQGDKQNVCVWLDQATWHDAKTGEGGGCKEFARTAFNMDLQEFILKFANPNQTHSCQLKKDKIFDSKIIESVHSTWIKLSKNIHSSNGSKVLNWLTQTRGFALEPLRQNFHILKEIDVACFDPFYARFIQQLIYKGSHILVPLRNVYSDRVQNIFFRCIDVVPKNEKSRLLPKAGGWSEQDGSPRAFGFPHLIHEFPNLVLCEGMADYFALECLLEGEENFLPIGAASAAALPKWTTWLAKNQYKGNLILVNQLDRDEGLLSHEAIGQKKSIEALKICNDNSIKAQFFDWYHFLGQLQESLSVALIADIADIFSTNKNLNDFHSVKEIFLRTLKKPGPTNE